MNDRLLTYEEMHKLVADYLKTVGLSYIEAIPPNIQNVAQDAKTSKWWIERIEKCGWYIIGDKWLRAIPEEYWKSLKKQIGGE